MDHMLRRWVRLSILLFVSGCAGLTNQKSPGSSARREAPAKGSAVEQQNAAEAAAIASVLQQIKTKGSDYRISGADLLEVTTYREQELNRAVRVSQNGTISLPLIGTIQVGGKTTAEAEMLVAGKLQDFLINPQVTIFIKEYGNKKIYVLGEVKKPGAYELPVESRLTVLEAVSLAEGFTPIAAKDRTKIIRSMRDGKSLSLTIEISAITTRGEKEKDIPLEPNDVVWVPQSYF
jgi:polysaccharide export outer membrane protein